MNCCIIMTGLTSKVFPSMCYASGIALSSANMGQSSSFTLHAFAEDGTKYVEPLKDKITCELVTTGSKRPRRVRGSVVNQDQEQYEIHYTPSQAHNSELSVKINGENIRGSPFKVVVRSSIAVHALQSGPIEIMEDLNYPNAIAIQSDRTRVVTENNTLHRVSFFDSEGGKISSFGGKGSGPGQFLSPNGIAVDAHDNILVVDSGNHRIQKFSKSGEFISQVGHKGSRKLQFKSPIGISVDHVSGKIFVADTHNHRIQVLNEDLSFSHEFGKKGKGNSKFVHPLDISVSVNGNVFVADSGNDRIQVFTTDGRYLRWIGQDGNHHSILDRPRSIAVDCSENIVVSCSHQNRVYVFDKHGYLLTVLGKHGDFSRVSHEMMSIASRGNGPGEFNLPLGVTIDNGGFVYVIDNGNSRMQMYL